MSATTTTEPFDARAPARAIAKARRRIRLQRALEGATTAVIPAGVLLMVGLVLFKLSPTYCAAWVVRDELWLFALGAGTLVFGGALTGALWRLDVIAAARVLDDRASLGDRLGTARDFQRSTERTAFMDAAIRDAARAAAGLRVGRFIPLRAPKDLGAASLTLLAVGLLVLVRFPPCEEVRVDPSRLAAPPPPPPIVAPFQAALAQKKIEESLKEAERLRDDETKKVLQKLDNLWKGMDARQFDKRELWRRIAQLQKQAGDKKLSPEDKAEMGRLQKMAQKLGKSQTTEKLRKALEKGDLGEAERQLRQLAKKLEDNRLSKKERKELEKALKKAAEKAQKQLSKMKRELEKLKKQLQKRKLEKLAKEKKERKLERLRKEMEKMQSQLATRLSQELMDALRKMKRYENADAGRSLRKAAEQMRQLMKKLRQMQLRAKTQDHIREMKELLRRGNQKGRDQQMKDFFARAGEGQGDDITLMLPGQGEKEGGGEGNEQGGKQLKPKGGTCEKCGGNHATGQHGSGQGQKPGQGEGGKGQGPGIGTGTDHRLGQATNLDGTKYRDVRLQGKKGRGESTSEVFMSAATRGFSRVGYKNVYNRYKEVVEEALEKNKAIPHGMRRIVEKYFEMIRPR